jgi:hypothetical protein
MKMAVLLPFVLIALILSAGCVSNSGKLNQVITVTPTPVTELTQQQRMDIGNSIIPIAKTDTGTNSPIKLRGKVILGFLSNNTYVDYNFLVPDNLTPYSNDKEITVLLMTEREYQQVGKWKVNSGPDEGQILPGYMLTTQIVGIYWPDNKIAGRAQVIGSEPNKSITKYYRPGGHPSREYISTSDGRLVQAVVGDDGITEWISNLSYE